MKDDKDSDPNSKHRRYNGYTTKPKEKYKLCIAGYTSSRIQPEIPTDRHYSDRHAHGPSYLDRQSTRIDSSTKR